MTTPYPHIFSPFQLGTVTLPNRMVMAPMSTELGGLEGEVTPQMIAFYRERALGGMGLIIVEYTCVSPETGRAHEYQLHLEDETNLEGHRRLVRERRLPAGKSWFSVRTAAITASTPTPKASIACGLR